MVEVLVDSVLRCHKISFQSVFTTVQPDGQLLVLRVIVESVPRADGQVKVPVEATLVSQPSVLYAEAFQSVKATFTELRWVQPLNMQ